MKKIENLSIKFEPREWQKDCMAKLSRFTVLALHRRAGKTTLAVAMLLTAALSNVGNYAYVSPQKNQSKTNMWDMIKFMLKDFLEYKGPIQIAEVRESDLSIRFHNGSKIWLLGAEDPDKVRGAKLNGAVVDEVAQMPREIWFEVLRPALMDTHGFALFIGTPKGVNLFSELFDRGHDPKYKGEWCAYKYTCYDTNALSPQEIEAYKAEVDENTFKREMLCDFSASGDDQLLSIEQVDAAMQREPDARALSTKEPLVMGVDVARFGSDKSVIVFRRGLVAEKPIYILRSTIPDLANFVNYHYQIRLPSAVFVDGTGVGGGVVDILASFGLPTYDINFASRSVDARYKNRRTEMWCRMADWVKRGAYIYPDQHLKLELCSPTYTTDEGGKICLESKKDIKTRLGVSPDFADALALTFAENLYPENDYLKRMMRKQLADEDMMYSPNSNYYLPAGINAVQRYNKRVVTRRRKW